MNELIRYRILFYKAGRGKINPAETVINAKDDQDAERQFYKHFSKKHFTFGKATRLPIAKPTKQ
jgi:hypothetical protein